MLPLIEKEGFKGFSLEIFVMPPKFSSDYYFLFLEQYYLLHDSFNLNTRRVVNFRVNQGVNIYLYDREGQILYYYSFSVRQMCEDIGISHLTLSKYLDKDGAFYLNSFRLTKTAIEGAKPSYLTAEELADMLLQKKKEYFKNNLLIGGNKNDSSQPLIIQEVSSGIVLNFPSGDPTT